MGNVLQMIMNMYKHTKSCVISNGAMSDIFVIYTGVRRGKNLCSLFLNDLEEYLYICGCLPLNVHLSPNGDMLTKYTELFVLLYMQTIRCWYLKQRKAPKRHYAASMVIVISGNESLTLNRQRSWSLVVVQRKQRTRFDLVCLLVCLLKAYITSQAACVVRNIDITTDWSVCLVKL